MRFEYHMRMFLEQKQIVKKIKIWTLSYLQYEVGTIYTKFCRLYLEDTYIYW